MKKICFAIYDMGAGHRSTANALKEVIEQKNLPWQVEVVEVFKEIFDTTRPQFVYNNFVLKKKWAKLINNPLSVPLFKLEIRLRHQAWKKRLQQYWRDRQPDLVVSLMPLVNRVLCESLQAELPDVPFVTSITDFADCPPNFWIEAQEQLLICPSQTAVRQARASGYPESSIYSTSGVVIHPRFDRAVKGDRATERQALGLKPDLPTGLVIFGSYGSPEMLKIAKSLESLEREIQLIFICGRNKELAAKLQNIPSRFPRVIEGFTKKVPDYMDLCDFFIGKPGSVGVSEAVARKLPVITECNNLTLFQERPSADWLVNNQLGIVVDNFRKINQAVAELIQPDNLSRYQTNVEADKNQAVFEVVDILEEILKDSELKAARKLIRV
ncbi:MAG: UDP-N-acetylglucosamine--LPS N-acetylglucosamine transferase [Cyanobacteria bacterium J06643_13]